MGESSQEGVPPQPASGRAEPQGLALGSALRTSRSSAAAPAGAGSDVLAQAASESGVGIPSSAPSHPISLHPPPHSQSSHTECPAALQTGQALSSLQVFAHTVPSAWKVIALFFPCPTLPFSVPTVDMDSPKECSLSSCPLWIPTHPRGHAEGLSFSSSSPRQGLYTAGLRVYLVRGLQMKGNELPMLEGLFGALCSSLSHFPPLTT